MSEKWTKGDWLCDGNLVYALHISPLDGLEENRFFAGVQGPRCPQEELEANAHLIAAAPDLYEALSNLLGVVYGDGGTTPDAKGMAERAIARARGE